jgi:hypothetical protein
MMYSACKCFYGVAPSLGCFRAVAPWTTSAQPTSLPFSQGQALCIRLGLHGTYHHLL